MSVCHSALTNGTAGMLIFLITCSETAVPIRIGSISLYFPDCSARIGAGYTVWCEATCNSANCSLETTFCIYNHTLWCIFLFIFASVGRDLILPIFTPWLTFPSNRMALGGWAFHLSMDLVPSTQKNPILWNNRGGSRIRKKGGRDPKGGAGWLIQPENSPKIT